VEIKENVKTFHKNASAASISLVLIYFFTLLIWFSIFPGFNDALNTLTFIYLLIFGRAPHLLIRLYGEIFVSCIVNSRQQFKSDEFLKSYCHVCYKLKCNNKLHESLTSVCQVL